MNKEFDTNFYLKKTFVSQINIVFRKRKLSRERERERNTIIARFLVLFVFRFSVRSFGRRSTKEPSSNCHARKFK